MKNNAIITDYKQIEVYENDAFILADEYINSLPLPEMIYKNSACFNGLLNYIFIHLFKTTEKRLYNLRTNIDTGNTELIMDIWYKVFTPLCHRYGKNRTIQRFSSFIGLNMDTFNTWKNGKVRNNSEGLSISHAEMYKTFLSDCESDLVGKAIEENGIGSIFILKSKYGYQEQNTITVQQGNALPSATLEQIQQQFSNTPLPPPVDID